MQRWDPLNDRQLMLLRRIGEGAEPVDSSDPGLAKSVYALRARGLVTTPREAGKWHAEITDAGRFYLEHGHHPDRPAPQPRRRRSKASSHETVRVSPEELVHMVEAAQHHLTIPNPPPAERAAWRRAVYAARRSGIPGSSGLMYMGRDNGDMTIWTNTYDMSKGIPSETSSSASSAQVPASPSASVTLGYVVSTTQLIKDIQAAGGRLTIDLSDPPPGMTGDTLDSLIRSIRRSHLLPAGMMLLEERDTWRIRMLTIRPFPTWISDPPAPIAVPAQIRDLPPVVVRLRDTEGLLSVSGLARPRALRLLHALVAAAAHRGYVARVDASGTRHRKRKDDPQIFFAIHGHEIGLAVTQENDRTEHVPTKKELADQARYSWTSIPKYDHKPSLRLKFTMARWSEYQQSNWTDSSKSQLEEKLPAILQEMEIRAYFAEFRRLAEEEKQRQRELEEQRRIAAAEVKFTEAFRVGILDAQLDCWNKARQLNEYIAAMAERIAELEDPAAVADASQWLSWVRAYADRLDPLNGKLALPPDPQPTRTDLRQYM
jgi:hypothetical protein